MATGFSYICSFAGVKTFVDMRETIGLSGTFWTYAVLSVFGLIFSLIFVPETKGRTLDEMEPKSSNNYGGSVNDVATKAVVAALKDTRVPKVEMVRRMFALPPKLT